MKMNPSIFRLQNSLQTIDFGGDLGIPYFPHEQALDMNGLRKELAALMAEFRDEPFLQDTRFIVEPGRFLVDEAGIYVPRVNDIKVSHNKNFIVVGRGIHHHLTASGNLGQTIKRNYPIAILNKLSGDPKEKVEFTGPLCTPLDVLGRAVSLLKLKWAILLEFFSQGAMHLPPVH